MGLKNKITIILFKIWPTNVFLKAKSYNFHFHKNDVTWTLSENGLFVNNFSIHSRQRFSYSVFYWTELNETVWDALIFFRLSSLLVSLNLFLGWERFLNQPYNVCLKQRHALHSPRKMTPLYLNVDKVSLLYFFVKI